MKTRILHSFGLTSISAITMVFVLNSCKSSSTSPTTSATPYAVTDLVADTAGYGAARIDPLLVNAWGISVGPTGIFWLSSNHGSVSTVYDGTGAQKIAPVLIPSRDSVAGGAPTATLFNSTADFAIPGVGPSKFIFAGEDGTISAWNGGGSAKLVVTDPSNDAVYKGMAMGVSGSNNYLYVTNFKEGKIVVYDKNFAVVNGLSFADPSIPAGYGPFGIANIGGKLYITYALRKAPDNEDDQAGPGYGYVDIFNTDGTLVKRFASGGKLNSPWAVIVAPSSFGTYSNDILVGNFGDGAITAFDSTGSVIGQLTDAGGKTLSVDGLWGLLVTGAPNDPAALYFAAGPSEENHGTFGYIKAQ